MVDFTAMITIQGFWWQELIYFKAQVESRNDQSGWGQVDSCSDMKGQSQVGSYIEWAYGAETGGQLKWYEGAESGGQLQSAPEELFHSS